MARTAACPRAPKLIAEMFSTDAEYGCAHCSPPMMTRRSFSGSATIGRGAMEWFSQLYPAS